nr:oligosaccharide flippase family protein [Rhizomicrobium palustre]
MALAVTIIAARFLAPADFGVFALAMACVTLVRNMLYSGGYEYLMKCSDPRSAATECLLLNAAMTVVLSLILTGLAYGGRVVFGMGMLTTVLLALIPSNFVSVLTSWQEAQILRGGRIRSFYLATATGDIVVGAIAIGLLWAGWGIWALVVQSYGRAILLTCFYAVIERPLLSERISRTKIIEIAHWSWSRYGSVSLSFLSNYAADFVLGVFLSPAATGIYRAGSRIVQAASDLFLQPAQTFGITLFSKRAALGLSPDDLWPKVLTAWMVLAWPALIGLAIAAGLLVPMILGPKWLLAAPVVSILCVRQLWSTFGAVTSAMLVAFNHQKTVFHFQLVTILSALAGLLIFARFGVIAAAASLTVIASIGNIWLLLRALHLFPGARREFAHAVITVIATTAATAAGAELFLFLAHGDLAKWQLVAALAFSGIFAWAFSAFLFRQRIIQSIHALAGG